MKPKSARLRRKKVNLTITPEMLKFLSKHSANSYTVKPKNVPVTIQISLVEYEFEEVQ